jgi:S1-C subfamily serine protease
MDEFGPNLPPPPPPFEGAPPPPPPGRPRALGVVAAIVAGLVLLATGLGLGWGLTRGTGTRASVGASPSTGLAGNDGTVGAIGQRVGASVVDINTTITDGFGGRGQGAGTGMIVSTTGQVLTNNHVIEGATRIVVTLPSSASSASYEARVVGVDPSDDVALLQVPGLTGAPAVSLGDSSQLEVGQHVVAIGNALGRGGAPAVTDGTISGLGRSISVGGSARTERLTGLIQTDAPIQPGDSGGPLVDSSGRVVGMITAARATEGGRTSNIGFAIPSNTALSIVNEIRAGNETSRVIIGPSGFLGVAVQEIQAGALVTRVGPETPAAAAGISEASVITAIDGVRIDSVDALGSAIHHHAPGDRISVSWIGPDGTHHTVSVRLISGPAV